MLLVRPASPARSSSVSKCAHSIWRVSRRMRDNQPGIRLLCRQREEIVPVAGNHEQVLRRGIRQRLAVLRPDGLNLSEPNDLVVFPAQDARNFLRHVVIEEKSHTASGGLICRATRASISDR